jgi:hypothetical protein
MDAIVAAIIRHQAIGSNTPSSAMPGALPNRWLSDGVTSATDRALPLKPFICVLWGISGLFVKAGVRVGRVARAIFPGRPTKLDTLIPNGDWGEKSLQISEKMERDVSGRQPSHPIAAALTMA